ncbi:alpha-L-fucosidase [Enterococcus gallinarum]|nr:alpha-L-fucosidase [Enterococcus gallinarum]
MKTFQNWPDHYPDPSWFIHDRFGLFIHFGLFSIGARHEWFMTTEEIAPKLIEKLISTNLIPIYLMLLFGPKQLKIAVFNI